MDKKKTSKTPSAPAVDRAAPCSGLLGKLGWFRDAGKRICIAEVKEVDVECPWASNMLLVLYERWPECEKHDGYIDPEDFHPLDCQNDKVRDGGPVASDSARDATPPFSAPLG